MQLLSDTQINERTWFCSQVEPGAIHAGSTVQVTASGERYQKIGDVIGERTGESGKMEYLVMFADGFWSYTANELELSGEVGPHAYEGSDLQKVVYS